MENQFDHDSTHNNPVNVFNLQAQQLDLDELRKLDSLLPTDDSESLNAIPDTEIDLDDILPSESFSAQPSPATSVVNGVVHKKPSISIFQHDDDKDEKGILEETGLLSPPESPPIIDRTKDDLPTRCSDIEDSPPLQAAGFIGDEIPTLDPLDSDGEWAPIPTLVDLLPTKAALQTNVNGQELGIIEGKKKRTKKKIRSKGVIFLLFSS
jgi:hypothetical protein